VPNEVCDVGVASKRRAASRVHEADEVYKFCYELVVTGWGGQLAAWGLRVAVKHDGLQESKRRVAPTQQRE
jgi:hypothetical protein